MLPSVFKLLWNQPLTPLLSVVEKSSIVNVLSKDITDRQIFGKT